jgi:hypothetical protein
MPDRRRTVQRDVVLPRIERKRDGWICVIAIEGEKYDAAPEKRSHEMKLMLQYDYKALPYKSFRSDVVKAIQRAKSKEESRKSAVPGFPGTDVYRVVESLPIRAVED